MPRPAIYFSPSLRPCHFANFATSPFHEDHRTQSMCKFKIRLYKKKLPPSLSLPIFPSPFHHFLFKLKNLFTGTPYTLCFPFVDSLLPPKHRPWKVFFF